MAKIPGVHVPAEVKNLAINGAFDYWQRVGSSTTTVNTASTTGTYTADMFAYSSAGSTTKNYSIVQSANVPTLAQSGFESDFSYLFTMITGISSFAAGDYVNPIVYKMEGYDFQRIYGKNITIGFWVYATATGTYSLALQNGGVTESYVTTFSISSSNTWQYISVSIPLTTTGTWNFTNGVGLLVFIGSVAGTTYQAAAGAWNAGNFVAASGATNWMATSSNVLQVAQFSITESNLGLGATGFQRAGKTIQQELALCQRYYFADTEPGIWADSYGPAGGGYVVNAPYMFPVTMRSVPTITFPTFSTTNLSGSPSLNFSSQDSILITAVNSGTGRFLFQWSSGSLKAEAGL